MTEVAVSLAELALLLGLVVALSAFMHFAYARIRHKGFQPPAAALFLALGLAAGAAAGACFLAGAPAPISNTRLFLYAFYLPILATTAATAALVVALPGRSARRFGERHADFPFARVGQGVIAAGILAATSALFGSLYYGWEFEQLARALTLVGGFIVPLGLYFLYLARRAQAPPLPAVIAQHARSPALYLRAFNQESQFFVIGPKSRYGAYAAGFGAALAKDYQNVGVTFEEYFAPALAKAVGPLVALGSPEDYIAPEGAARLYAKDADWMERLKEMAREAACIVVEVGKSGNLRWEFEQLRRDGLQTKLFVFTRGRRESGTRLAWAFYGLLWRIKGIETVSWREVAADLSRMGYELADDPGHGAVVTFDDRGKSVLLTTEASLPAEFVEPIAGWIRGRTYVGKCIPASCTTCGRRHHVAPSAAPSPGGAECADCARARVLANRSLRERWNEGVVKWYVWWVIGSIVVVPVSLAFLPETPWLDEWQGWLGTLAIVIFAVLPFGIGALLPDRKLLGLPSTATKSDAPKR